MADDPSILSRFTVVLWRPGSPGNVGSVARAMKNMGFTRLAVAEPRAFEDPGHFIREAGRMAWDAEDLLHARREHAGLREALAGASFVAGTTWRPPPGHEAMAPRALAATLLDEARRGEVALLFGQESIGLTLEALGMCQVLGTVPTSPLYGSLNLAQAALLFLYEIRLAALSRLAVPPTAPPAECEGDDARPRRSEVDAFYGRLEAALEEIGFFEGDSRPHMILELRKLLNRSITTRRELAILEGIVHRIRLARPR